MIKVDCISDTHTRHNELRYTGGDIIIHAGDVSAKGDDEQIFNFLSWFESLPYERKILVPGNHDFALSQPLYQSLFQQSGIHLLIDKGVYIEGVGLVYGSPWTPKFYNWAFMYERNSEEAREIWKRVPEDTDILVTHGPPRDILDYSTYSQTHDGCEVLRDRVLEVKPKYHIFGHFHHSHGIIGGETTYVNAAMCDEQYRLKRTPVVLWM